MRDKTEPKKETKEGRPGDCRPVVDMGSTVLHTERGTVYCLTVIGEIEGHMASGEGHKTTKYEHVIPLLAGIEGSEEIDGLLILLNTVGGDVEAGLAMAELIAGLSKPTVTLVLGGGHSIGVPLAVAGKRSMIVPSASMTVHPIRMSGMLIAAPQTYRYFERLQEQIVRFVAGHSRISEEKFTELMMSVGDMSSDVGTVLYGSEAVRLGLIDREGNVRDALETLYGMIEEQKRSAE